MSSLPFAGTERVSLELEGTLDPERATALLGPGLEPELLAGGRARCALLFFSMGGLKLQRVPGPAFSYREALWRVGARWPGGEGWFAVACDLDAWSVRPLASTLIRYPVRPAELDVVDAGSLLVTVRAGGATLSLTAEPAEAAAVTPPRRTLVRRREKLFEVPWDEVPAPTIAHARVTFTDVSLATATLGEVTWAERGTLLHGRGHRCGLARPLTSR